MATTTMMRMPATMRGRAGGRQLPLPVTNARRHLALQLSATKMMGDNMGWHESPCCCAHPPPAGLWACTVHQRRDCRSACGPTSRRLWGRRVAVQLAHGVCSGWRPCRGKRLTGSGIARRHWPVSPVPALHRQATSLCRCHAVLRTRGPVPARRLSAAGGVGMMQLGPQWCSHMEVMV